ncbi:hypothetical protein [Tranquillimonas rosea]|uniref:hypothetical protein n=1 Tax=Tranquillimonas rosea TaxID=641238 RepID=UPI003BA9B1F9
MTGSDAGGTVMEMTAQEWLVLLALGGGCGLTGQVARMVIGLKKLWSDSADMQEAERKLSPARLMLSLVIGAAAGALAAVVTVSAAGKVNREEILGLIAAGYAGADFIEGAIKKRLPTG